jgi:hypothetical protein
LSGMDAQVFLPISTAFRLEPSPTVILSKEEKMQMNGREKEEREKQKDCLNV